MLPKRLRYFLNGWAELAGEASRILARELELHYRRELGDGSPAQMHFIQRLARP